MYVFGFDVGGTTIKCGFFTEEGVLVDKWEIPTNQSADNQNQIPADIAKAIDEKLLEKNVDRKEVKGVGLGIPGPISKEGDVFHCPNLKWGRVPIRRLMEEKTGYPVRVGNDANVAALGEMFKGGGQGHSDIVMVTLGTGVGGGVIVNGKIVGGFMGGGGEIGHIIVNEEETAKCGCGGHGHLEQYASATGIVRVAKKELDAYNGKTSLNDVEKLTAKDIFDHAKAGDEFAIQVVEKCMTILAAGLKPVACTVNPEVFVIGGGVSKAGTIITESLKKHMSENMMYPLGESEIKLATLGNDAGIYGAAKMIIDEIL
ncbi:MAG: ROK family glucokinase [Lachnospiraceae bacterium]|nr:ROK family glucokinase [Lachnospiraceae bacterium]